MQSQTTTKKAIYIMDKTLDVPNNIIKLYDQASKRIDITYVEADDNYITFYYNERKHDALHNS